VPIKDQAASGKGGSDSDVDSAEAILRPSDAEIATWNDATAALQLLADRREPFTVEDLFELAGLPPHPYSISAVLPTFVKNGRIVRAGAAIAPSGRPRLLWIGAER
jgi:hypothetical protein